MPPGHRSQKWLTERLGTPCSSELPYWSVLFPQPVTVSSPSPGMPPCLGRGRALSSPPLPCCWARPRAASGGARLPHLLSVCQLHGPSLLDTLGNRVWICPEIELSVFELFKTYPPNTCACGFFFLNRFLHWSSKAAITVLQIEWFKQQKFIIAQFWKLEA